MLPVIIRYNGELQQNSYTGGNTYVLCVSDGITLSQLHSQICRQCGISSNFFLRSVIHLNNPYIINVDNDIQLKNVFEMSRPNIDIEFYVFPTECNTIINVPSSTQIMNLSYQNEYNQPSFNCPPNISYPNNEYNEVGNTSIVIDDDKDEDSDDENRNLDADFFPKKKFM